VKLVLELSVEPDMHVNAHKMPETSRRLWATTFVGLFLSVSWMEVYPDHPLWLAFLLIPLMVAQAVFFSFDWIIVFHLLRLAAAFGILVGASWVMHCGLIMISRYIHLRRKQA
jgi:hypothetical protein